MSCTVDRTCSVRSRNTGTPDFLLRGQLSVDALPCNAGLFRLGAHEVRCRNMDGSIERIFSDPDVKSLNVITS